MLDVAAGKGELAFELLNLNGVPAVALEPRLLQLQKFTKWLQVRRRDGGGALLRAWAVVLWHERSGPQGA